MERRIPLTSEERRKLSTIFGGLMLIAGVLDLTLRAAGLETKSSLILDWRTCIDLIMGGGGFLLLRSSMLNGEFHFIHSFIVAQGYMFDATIQTNEKILDKLGFAHWCRIVDAFQTSAIAADNDYELKHLVEVFGLSGDLLNA
jgi:hypothetical protein